MLHWMEIRSLGNALTINRKICSSYFIMIDYIIHYGNQVIMRGLGNNGLGREIFYAAVKCVCV